MSRTARRTVCRVASSSAGSEQKATLAAMLIAIEAVARSGIGLSGRLLFACCTSGESGKHDALRCVVEEAGVRADMAVLSGDSLTLSLGNRGRIDVVVTVEGRAAHSSSPHTGCNAVTGMIDVIRKVGEQVRLDAIHPDLGRPTLAVTRIRSYPESTHTIQARCDVTFDRRLLPGEDPHAAFSAIAAAAAMVDGTPDPVSGIAYRVRTELGPFMYPSLLAPDAPAVVRLVAAVEEALGQRPQTHFAAYAFDQGYLNHVGIPAVNWGPGEYAFAHTDLDMASVERTRDAALAYALLIVRELI
jgi:acetylornithine deacetylase/succinyl-diaminopimelate desuccinylase-like protein